MKIDEYETPNRVTRLVWVAVVLVIVVGACELWWFARKRSEPAAVPAPSVVPSPSPGTMPVASPVSQASDSGQVSGLTPTQQSSSAAVPAVVVGLEVTQSMAEAEAFVGKDALVEARDKYTSLLQTGLEDALRIQVEAQIGWINTNLVRTPRGMPEKTDYTVQPGDSVAKIAQKFGTTVELVQESNMLARPDLIKAGDRLRVVTGKFTITVSKSRKDLLLTLNGLFFKRYRVGTGKYGKTPVGTFVINDRIKEPPWWRGDGKVVPFGDKQNILGTRWLALSATGKTESIRGYGIHGTWDNESIGKAESAGCIRLRNEEVEELYTLVPLGTPVTIEE